MNYSDFEFCQTILKIDDFLLNLFDRIRNYDLESNIGN